MLTERRRLIEQCTPEEREQILAAAWTVARSKRLRASDRQRLDLIRRELELSKGVAQRIENQMGRRRREPKEILPLPGEAARALAFHYVAGEITAEGAISARERSIAEKLGLALGWDAHRVSAELDDYLAASLAPPPVESSDLPRRLVADDCQALVRRAESAQPVQGSVVLTILANLIPLAGVLFLNWDLVVIFVVYWLETVIIAIFTLLKMCTAKAGRRIRPGDIIGYIVVYGGLAAMYSLVILGVVAAPRNFPEIVADLRTQWPSLAAALVMMFLEHGFEFVEFLRHGRHRAADVDALGPTPILRLLVIHVSLALGGFFTVSRLPGMGPLCILIGVKTICDLPPTELGMRVKWACGVGAVAGVSAFAAGALLLMFPAAVIADSYPGAIRLVLYAFSATFFLSCAAAIGSGLLYVMHTSPRNQATPSTSITWRVVALTGLALVLLYSALGVRHWDVRSAEEPPTPAESDASAAVE